MRKRIINEENQEVLPAEPRDWLDLDRLHPAVQPHLSHGRRSRRDRQARLPTHAASELCQAVKALTHVGDTGN